MRVLGLDTATTGCSVALWANGMLEAHRFEVMERGQAERLNPMIGEVMSEAGIGFADLDRVGVTTGPGAFTGVRIGLAAARGLALAARVPVFGITTFAALAEAVPAAERRGRTLVVLVNAKRRDVFIQVIGRPGEEEAAPFAAEPGDLPDALPGGAILLAGDGVPQVAAALEGHGELGTGRDARLRLSSAVTPPDAAHVAALAAVAAEPGVGPGAGRGADGGPKPRPLYIRAPDACLPVAEGRRRP